MILQIHCIDIILFVFTWEDKKINLTYLYVWRQYETWCRLEVRMKQYEKWKENRKKKIDVNNIQKIFV